jgi:hypothetical protein
MVKKIYNVILQSAIGDGTLSNETFFYDWTQIPDVPYKLTFSFTSATTALSSNSQVASLYIDLSQSNNQLAKPQTTIPPNYPGQFLGNLYFGFVSANNFLYAENNTNPPTYLNGRPKSNNFAVQIHSTPTVDFSPPVNHYSLILSFEEY